LTPLTHCKTPSLDLLGIFGQFQGSFGSFLRSSLFQKFQRNFQQSSGFFLGFFQEVLNSKRQIQQVTVLSTASQTNNTPVQLIVGGSSSSTPDNSSSWCLTHKHAHDRNA